MQLPLAGKERKPYFGPATSPGRVSVLVLDVTAFMSDKSDSAAAESPWARPLKISSGTDRGRPVCRVARALRGASRTRVRLAPAGLVDPAPQLRDRTLLLRNLPRVLRQALERDASALAFRLMRSRGRTIGR